MSRGLFGKVLKHRNSPMGWHPTWRLTSQPGIGDAPQFAFTTLALKPAVHKGYIVPVAVRATSMHPQIEHQLQHRIDGYGLAAGQINAPSLINPYVGLPVGSSPVGNLS